MNSSKESTRRQFIKDTSTLVAVGTLAGMTVPLVHAAQDSTVQVALVGCGGRGTGAATNALSVKSGPIKLVAMADVFRDRLNDSIGNLNKSHEKQVDVPPDRRFIGFDAYKEAIDCLRPGDVAIFATPPAFRWVHFKYAIEKGVNVFMEKPVTVDGPSTRKMLELGEKAKEKNLKVAVGLMCRHCEARGELFKRIQDGEIGDLITLRCYRMHPPVGSAFSPPRPEGVNELEYQIRRFHSFLWASGGCYSDFYIHNIDECCWMKNAWPVQAQATGGRHYRNHATDPSKGQDIDQNFDNYSVEYTFADGSNMFLYGRTMPGCHDEFASYAHGSKGLGIISTSSHSPAKCRIYSGQKEVKDKLAWAFPQPEPNPYQLEWEHLIDAIRTDRPHNEVKRGAEASLVTAMGRMAAHTGQVITFDDMLNCEHEFAPNVDKLVLGGEAPIQADASGRYPVPMPGLSDREYAA
ncbi:MAG TPA: Gfo/Idh/MocA family oxidoreductase [Pirellulaceae bacterium]|nr:Gfo/Idh/MocA family oxidoreductase [Pirellulaceae bacterium]